MRFIVRTDGFHFILSYFRPQHCGRVKEFFEESLRDLGVDYVDLVGTNDVFYVLPSC